MKRVLLVQSFIEKGAQHRSFQTKKIDVFNGADEAFSVDHGVLAKMVFTVKNNSFDVINWLNKTKVTDYDAVIFDHWRFKLSQAMALAVFLTRKSIPFRTHEPEHIPALDKLGELARMSDQNISLPDSLVCQGTIAVNALKVYGGFLGWPLIAKVADGSQGNDNYLVKNLADFRPIAKKFGTRLVVLQKFIPNTCDYRILVIDGKIMFIMKRQRASNDTHLNNTSKGAGAERMPDDYFAPDVLDEIVRAAQVVGRLELAGVDLLIDDTTGQHYILEVNKTPNIVKGATKELEDEKISLITQQIKSLLNI